MAFLDRLRRGRRSGGRRGGSAGAPSGRASAAVDEAHLTEFVTSRRGVEGFVEPRTTVSEVTLLLVAHDGEWTRRRVPSVSWAHGFANRHGVPSYDAAVVGIPDRMRAWSRREAERQKQARKAQRRELGL